MKAEAKPITLQLTPEQADDLLNQLQGGGGAEQAFNSKYDEMMGGKGMPDKGAL